MLRRHVTIWLYGLHSMRFQPRIDSRHGMIRPSRRCRLDHQSDAEKYPNTALKAAFGFGIAVFPILADAVEVKTGSRSTAHWRIHFIRPNGWLRHSFAQLITRLDIDGIGQN